MDRMRLITQPIVAGLAWMAIAAPLVGAQQDTTVRIDARWRAYLGCWSTVASGERGPDVCFVPTSDSQTVERLLVSGDSILERSSVSSAGRRVERRQDGCTGWESGQWSADDRRLYTRTEFTCDGGRALVSTGLYAMVLPHQFSRIEGVTTRTGRGVRAIRFGTLPYTVALPDSIARRLPAANERAFAARFEAAAEVSSADVVDAVRAIDSSVVATWIADRQQRFPMTVSDARALRDARVPASVIDMMVAVSYPERFTISTPGGRTASATGAGSPVVSARPADRSPIGESSLFNSGYLMADEFFGNFSGYGSRQRFISLSHFGNPFNPFRDCFYSLECSGGTTWAAQTAPHVIAPLEQRGPFSPGRATNGAGYSQGSGSSDTGRSAQPSGGGGVSSDGLMSGGSTSTGGGGGSGVSTSTGGASSAPEQRTAKPRP